jgi:predicted ATPase
MKRPSAAFRGRARRGGSHLPIGALVGRDDDIVRVLDSLSCVSRGAGSRLVTILGPPGIGKTRLAERCMELVADSFADEGGTWFCDLSSVTDVASLVHAVACALRGHGGEGAAPSEDAGDLVDDFAAAGPMFLVLDNFEQLVPVAADVVHGWCQAAPELSVLVTSRQRLGVEGEVVVELGPLGCPADGATEEEVLASDAVRLLVLRAKAAGGDVGRDPRVLGDLARQLDGIPLAIELAAARTRVLSPIELVGRIAQRFDVLARRPLHARDRHATLGSAIEWSWQLLSPEEQRALGECSVFAGDFTIDAAEAVLGERAVDLVGALRDKSLVHVPSEGRLALYVSIREYAVRRLAARGQEELGEARLRHASFYAAASRAFVESRTLQGGPDAALRIRLARDRANLLAALAFVRDGAGAPKLLAEIALGLTLLQAAPAELCLGALGVALASIEGSDPPDPALVAHILFSRQDLLGAVGRFQESRTDLSRLLAMDLSPALRCLVLVMQGIQLRREGLTREARRSHLEAARTVNADTPTRLLAVHHACMGRLGHELGDDAAAREHNGRARLLAADIGDAWTEALALANLALLEQEHGRFETARRLLDDALAKLEQTDEQHYVAVYSIAYGDLLFEQGQPEEARKCYERAARFFGGWYASRQRVELYSALAALEARYGTLDDAELYLERARRSTPRNGSSPLLELVVEAHGAQLELRRAHDATFVHGRRGSAEDRTRDDASGREGVFARVRARHGELVRSDVAASSFIARFALRMLERTLDGETSTDTFDDSRVRAVIVVARDGTWFRRDGKRVELGRRGSLRRILAALVAAPKTGIDRDSLLAVGWPGERLLHDAASKRLRVAVATLRALGLRDAIVTREDGYALDPHVIQQIVGDV